jgi:hypothetical protein
VVQRIVESLEDNRWMPYTQARGKTFYSMILIENRTIGQGPREQGKPHNHDPARPPNREGL